MVLAIVGVIGFFVLRRWPRTVLVVAPALIVLTGVFAHAFVPMVASLARPEVRSYLLPEVSICAAAALVGLGLPLLAWRSRSRPAT
jgi:NADH:ubiquinone oxidoreductase subunit K